MKIFSRRVLNKHLSRLSTFGGNGGDWGPYIPECGTNHIKNNKKHVYEKKLAPSPPQKKKNIPPIYPLMLM